MTHKHIFAFLSLLVAVSAMNYLIIPIRQAAMIFFDVTDTVSFVLMLFTLLSVYLVFCAAAVTIGYYFNAD